MDIIENALNNATRSKSAQLALLLAFIEQQGLTTALAEHLQAAGEVPIPEDKNARFLFDVDVLMSDATELAHNRAKLVLQHNAVNPDEFYGSNDRADYTLAKCFVSAMGKEIERQFKPLSSSKQNDAVIARIKGFI